MLLGGFAIAMAVVFARPIQYLFDLARDVERNSGLALVPALIILTVVFVFHQQGKRQEAKARATAAEADAQQADLRAAEMERLVTFGQALGRSLDLDAIRDVVAQHLPKLASSDDAWVLLRARGHWEALAGTYEVQASAPNCHAPGNPAAPTVTTSPFVIPPPVTGLVLKLECPGATAPTRTPNGANSLLHVTVLAASADLAAE